MFGDIHPTDVNILLIIKHCLFTSLTEKIAVHPKLTLQGAHLFFQVFPHHIPIQKNFQLGSS